MVTVYIYIYTYIYTDILYVYCIHMHIIQDQRFQTQGDDPARSEARPEGLREAESTWGSDPVVDGLGWKMYRKHEKTMVCPMNIYEMWVWCILIQFVLPW